MNAELLERLSQGLVANEEAEPVFVVGSVRSGTSIVMEALRSGGELRGFNEGNVASMVQRLFDVLDSFQLDAGPLRDQRPPEVWGIDPEGFRNATANYIGALYAKVMGPGPWMDKSPESYLGAPMIRFCPTLLKLFPKARFLFCLRRGIENVMSRQRKFPDVPFRSLCRSWADAAAAWWQVRDELGDRGLIARQNEIALQPEKVASEIAAFLGMEDRRRLAIEGIFTHERPEQSQFAQEHRFLGLEETPWDEEQREIFREVCAEMMEKTGYPLDGAALVTAAPIRLFYPVAEESVEKRNLPGADSFRRGEKGALELDAGAGEAAEVRYLEVPLCGQKTFSARVEVPRSAPEGVSAGFRLETPAGEVAVSREVEVAPGSHHEWREDFDAQDGVFSVVISARRAGATKADQPAAAIWKNARLEV